jgi:hypothetical protein
LPGHVVNNFNFNFNSIEEANCHTGFGDVDLNMLWRYYVPSSLLLVWFDMAFYGPGNYVVVVLPTGGFKSSEIFILSVSLVPVKCAFLPVIYCLTRNMSTQPFASCLRKPA